MKTVITYNKDYQNKSLLEINH